MKTSRILLVRGNTHFPMSDLNNVQIADLVSGLPRPAAVVMAYTGHSEIARQGETDPPTFVVAGEQDRIAPADVMERRVAALRQAGARVEYRRYAGVGHGFGAGTGTSAEGWIDDAIRFWEGVVPNAGT